MATQALYLKWRPQTFDEVIGQKHITRTLLGAIRQNRTRHAYLLSGPRGTGKTTTARLLAKAVNCLHDDINQRPCDACSSCHAIRVGRFLDIIEIDAASHTGVDDVRELRDKIAFAPSEGRYKVYIIDEVHRFSGSAFDALLKTLEEPPAHAIFVLATTEIHKVPDTIKSRCLIFEFRRVPLRELVDHLHIICEGEGISIDDNALELIARQGTGSVRDSISLLDQIVADPDEHVSYEMAQAMLGAAGSQYVWEIAQAIIENDAGYGLEMVNAAVDTGADPRQFGRQVVEHLRKLLLARMGSVHLVDASDEIRGMLAEQAQYCGHRQLLKAIRAFNAAIENMRGGWQPQLPLEMALVESVTPVDEAPLPVPPRQRRSPPPPQSASTPTRPVRQNIETPSDDVVSVDQPSEPDQGISLGEFVHQWERVLNIVYQHKGPESLLRQCCRPLRVSGQTLVIGINNPTLRPNLEKDRNRQVLHAAIQEIFGEGVTVRIELVEGSESTQESLLIDQDDLLLFAKTQLGAEITFEENEE